MLIWTETFIHFKVLHYFQLSGEVPIKTLSTHDIYAGLTQTQYRIIYVHNVNTITYLAIPEMYQYCVLMFIVFEAACPLNVAWNAWLRHLVVLRKLQESTTVWVTLALAFLHAFNKKVICNNWLENNRKTIYWCKVSAFFI